MRIAWFVSLLLVTLSSLAMPAARGDDASPVALGGRRELFVDDFLIERFIGKAELRLHSPQPREIAFQCDAAWEGGTSGYTTIFRDGDVYRMYFRGSEANVAPGRLNETVHPYTVSYAESRDGIHWRRPELGLFEFRGSKRNNIVWMGVGTSNFCPFVDMNPNCLAAEKYKAVGSDDVPYKLHGFVSPDGLHWKRVQDAPIFKEGTFDSQNLVFWDSQRQQYAAYFRYFSGKDYNGYRLIGTATSPDFLHWSKRQAVNFDLPAKMHLYTNQILPYFRAPHLYFGFPTRYTERKKTLHSQSLPPVEVRAQTARALARIGTDLTDGLFITSRDGVNFHRWDEAFIRPGPQEGGQWMYGDNYQAWGLVETAAAEPGLPPEISLYAEENSWRGAARRLRRHTLRLDGFVSLSAPLGSGFVPRPPRSSPSPQDGSKSAAGPAYLGNNGIVTRPFTFTGNQLTLNYSTSGGGQVKVELQTAAGVPIPGFTLADALPLYGDTVAQVVHWNGGSDVSRLAGQPLRLSLILQDADVYAFQFVTASGPKAAAPGKPLTK